MLKEESEHIKLAMLLDWCMPDLLWHTIPNGGFRSQKEAIRLKKQGVKKGVADIFILYPTAHSHGLFLELKTKGGKLSKAQKKFGEDVEAQGYSFTVQYGHAAAFNYIVDYTQADGISKIKSSE